MPASSATARVVRRAQPSRCQIRTNASKMACTVNLARACVGRFRGLAGFRTRAGARRPTVFPTFEETAMTTMTSLQTDKGSLGRTRIATTELAPLRPGEALLKIDRLAVTANNITYAAFGEVPHLRYWDFFPTGAEGFGHMPAWGFATVEATTVEGLAVGERFYGYWPIADRVVMQPVRVGERGFYDGTPHRLALTSAYNQYQRVSTDAAHRAADEGYQALLRPLFITSFMLADFL